MFVGAVTTGSFSLSGLLLFGLHFPVRFSQIGKVPEFDSNTWDFRVEGLVENPVRLTYDELLALE